MQRRNSLSILVLALLGCTSSNLNVSEKKLVYGEDSRRLYNEMSPQEKQLAKASVLLVSKDEMDFDRAANAYVFRPNRSVGSLRHLCPSEKFALLPSVGSCSGFLAENNDQIVSAGHCFGNNYACENTFIVFNYLDAQDSGKVTFPAKDVFSCKAILSRRFRVEPTNHSLSTVVRGEWFGGDYMMMRLDRPQNQISPVQLDRNYSFKPGKAVSIFGFPDGQPLTGARGKIFKDYPSAFFTTDLDSFHGNSGSMVVDPSQSKAIGLLSAGDQDYEYDFQQGCVRSRYCESASLSPEKGCAGQAVFKASALPRVGTGETVSQYAVKKVLAKPRLQSDVALPVTFELQVNLDLASTAGHIVDFEIGSHENHTHPVKVSLFEQRSIFGQEVSNATYLPFTRGQAMPVLIFENHGVASATLSYRVDPVYPKSSANPIAWDGNLARVELNRETTEWQFYRLKNKELILLNVRSPLALQAKVLLLLESDAGFVQSQVISRPSNGLSIA